MEISFAKYKIVIAAACVLILALAAFLFFYRTAAANLIWKTVKLPGPALALDQHDAVLAFKIGEYYYGQGTYEPVKAEGAYAKAVAIDPALPFAHYQLGRVLFVEGRSRQALDAFDAELSLNPSNFRSYYMRGLTYAYAGKLSIAEADFKTFIAHAPTEWAGYNDLAWVLARERKYAEAEVLLTTALKTIPGGAGNPWLLNNLGVQQLNLMHYADAAASFESAQRIAATLTVEMWHRAYPGNDAAASTDGIDQFQKAVDTNLQKAKQGLASS